MANVRKYGTRLANTIRARLPSNPKTEEQVYYTQNHQWVRIQDEEQRTAVIGITDYGQDRMGCVTYVDFDTQENDKVFRGHSFVTVKSRFNAELQSIKMPINAKITAINNKLSEIPLMVNRAPENEGWMLSIQVDKIRDVTNLMTREEYGKFLERQNRRMASETGN